MTLTSSTNFFGYIAKIEGPADTEDRYPVGSHIVLTASEDTSYTCQIKATNGLLSLYSHIAKVLSSVNER